MNKLSKAFLYYHKANPEMFEAYLKYAREADNNTAGILSISMITERIRWETLVCGTGEFKVQNSFRAYYTRLLIWKYPKEFCFRFHTRRVPIDGISTNDPSTWDQEYWSQFNE